MNKAVWDKTTVSVSAGEIGRPYRPITECIHG